jgi:hypothetical protein
MGRAKHHVPGALGAPRYVTEIIRVAQELAKTVPSGKHDCDCIERQGQAALRVLDRVAA